MDQDELAAIVIWNAHGLYTKTIGGSDETARVINRKMRAPRPGDLVYENSTRDPKSLGRLIAIRQESYESEDRVGSDTFYYIETLANELARWSNCEFIRVLERPYWTLKDDDPENQEWAQEAAKRHGLEEAS